MKKSCFCFLLLFYVNSQFAQVLKLEEVLENIRVEPDDNNRIDLIYDLYFNTLETNPALGIGNAQQVLLQSQKQKDKIGEAMALCMIGANFRQLGNTIKGLEYNFKAKALAEATSNLKLLAVIKNAIGNVYNDREEFRKALELYLGAESAAAKEKCVKIQGFAFINLGKVYLTLNKADSALIFTQRAYELSLQNNFSAYLGSILTQLGGVQAKLGNESLAVNYYNLGIKEALKTNFPRHLYWAYLGLAQYYAEHNKFDSCKAYSKKAIAAVQNTPLSNLNIKPAKMLLDLYENKNSDSAMKYFKIYKIAYDSLFSTKAIQQPLS